MITFTIHQNFSQVENLPLDSFSTFFVEPKRLFSGVFKFSSLNFRGGKYCLRRKTFHSSTRLCQVPVAVWGICQETGDN